MRNRSFVASGVLLTLLATAMLLSGCERPPVDTVQRGYRGTGMEQVYNPRLLAEQAALNAPPVASPPVPEGGPKASEVFKNVKVLGDLSAGEFTRLMVAMTSWVAPEQGCNYCHNPADLADDSVYTKVVARRMIEMTRHINVDWQKHVGDTGVTCYTCHRGNPVPTEVWFAPPLQRQASTYAGNDAGQNKAARAPAYASLPYDPFGIFLQGGKTAGEIAVIGDNALPTAGSKGATIQDTEATYALMMHMSKSLGVNCTYCHNTRSFADWESSTPQRATAWHGIRLARDLNESYLTPLQGSFPAERLGPQGDVGKINCATCHQGAYKPLYGTPLLKDHPTLGGAAAASMLTTTATAAPAAAAAPTLGAAPGATATFYFAVGSSALAADAATSVGSVADALKARADAKAVLSGYHSAAGTQAQNEELAKQRAFAVRDALKAAGVSDDRLVLDKPQQTAGNVSGEDPMSRRVDVTVR